jgi:hypothetical protein
MKVGESMTHASVIGSTFDGRIVAETTVGGRPAIVPAIRGSAWITGVTELYIDPTTLPGGLSAVGYLARGRSPVGEVYLRMFTARAAASSTVMPDVADSASIISFARVVSGMASVGLKAIEFVNET